ncbi:hypothetical protein [Gordonia soli]|nr:hypothetical protein [Gordonia soli]
MSETPDLLQALKDSLRRDPAVAAAQRAWDRGTEPDLGYDDMIAAAREALAPIRAVAARYEDDYIGGFSIDDILTELRPLIYAEEEL